MIGDDDWGVFLDTGPSGHAVAAAWTIEGAALPVPVPGIYEAPHQAAAGGDWPGVSTTLPVLVTGAPKLPTTAAKGDLVEIPGRGVFLAADLQPDGAGLVRVSLERAE